MEIKGETECLVMEDGGQVQIDESVKAQRCE